jgi:hypothetical protein
MSLATDLIAVVLWKGGCDFSSYFKRSVAWIGWAHIEWSR